MFALVVFVVLAIAPDKPIQLLGPRFATEQQCEQVTEKAQEKLTDAYNKLGLEAQVAVKCLPTGQRDL